MGYHSCFALHTLPAVSVTWSYFTHFLQTSIAVVHIVTEEFAVDLGSGLRLIQPSLFVTGNWRTPFKITLNWSAAVFCTCDIIQLFSVVLCVVVLVFLHKFDFQLVLKESTTKWRPMGRRRSSDRDSCFWQYIYVFRRPSLRVLRGCPRCADFLHSLE
jgi:hypothetical protein